MPQPPNTLHKPYTIFHVVESFGGGCLTSLALLTHSLGDSYQHVIAYSERSETFEDVSGLFPENVRLVPFDMNVTKKALRTFEAVIQLKRMIVESRSQIVHCHSSIGGVLGRCAARYAGIPSVYTPHAYSFLRTDVPPALRWAFRSVEWVMTRCGNVIAACGDEEYKEALKLSGNGTRVFLARNGVDIEALGSFIPKGNVEKQCRDVFVATCGRLTVQHGMDWFNQAATAMHDEAQWIWVGAEKDTTLLPIFVLRTDWVDRTTALNEMAGSDIFLHPTRWDGLSYALLEAMALKKPVVASDIAPNRSVIKHGVTGFLAKSADEMIQYTRLLVNDPVLRRKIGETAYDFIKQNNNIKAFAESYATIYRNLLE
jgi:Glycosyltransferase